MTDRPLEVLGRHAAARGRRRDRQGPLDHVTFTVEPGHMVAVVGPSGAGKSSLLAVAGAFIAPTTGQVRLAGVELAKPNRRQLGRLRRDRFGFVFQSANLIPALSALDQLRLPLTFGKTDRPRDPPPPRGGRG